LNEITSKNHRKLKREGEGKKKETQPRLRDEGGDTVTGVGQDLSARNEYQKGN